MLPKRHRLLLRQVPDFFKRAQRWYGEVVVMYFTRDAENSLGAVIVPKKTVKTSVKRHALKRRARNIVLPYLKKAINIQVALVLKNTTQEISYSDLQKDINTFFNTQ